MFPMAGSFPLMHPSAGQAIDSQAIARQPIAGPQG
jgi:hypothetical protein